MQEGLSQLVDAHLAFFEATQNYIQPEPLHTIELVAIRELLPRYISKPILVRSEILMLSSLQHISKMVNVTETDFPSHILGLSHHVWSRENMGMMLSSCGVNEVGDNPSDLWLLRELDRSANTCALRWHDIEACMRYAVPIQDTPCTQVTDRTSKYYFNLS